MGSFHEYIDEYRKQLKKGDVQKAYKGVMEYIMELRSYFQNKYPDYFVSGNIYHGYMDMTYFSFSPKPLKAQKLRIAVVFLHEAFRFEAWLAGYNKHVQSKYWNMIKKSGWSEYALVPSIKGADSIIEFILVDNPDFSSPEVLTKQIENAALSFISDIESYLAVHQP
jgi:hypothetical protein